MSLNPHPIVLTAASERRRAELLALANPEQSPRTGLACANSRLERRVDFWTRAASGILALLLAAARQG